MQRPSFPSRVADHWSRRRERGLVIAKRIAVTGVFLIVATPRMLVAGDVFVQPEESGQGTVAVWGHKNGLRIGLAPTPGPAGLIRIFTPYLEQPYPRVVNFVSIEPSVEGHPGRGQSELEMSRLRPGSRGLSFWASNEIASDQPPAQFASGVVDEAGDTLRLFIHTEPFLNGAHPIIECIFRAASPYEVEFRTHAAKDSAEMNSCTLSATMGNFGILRQIHLNENRIVEAKDLWNNEEPLDGLGFLPWRTWPASELARTQDGRCFVQLSTDLPNPADAKHDPNVARHWRYVGQKAIHYWRSEWEAQPVAAVNGRRTYWMSQSPIPGGIAFENFELRTSYTPGGSFWFGVRPDDISTAR